MDSILLFGIFALTIFNLISDIISDKKIKSRIDSLDTREQLNSKLIESWIKDLEETKAKYDALISALRFDIDQNAASINDVMQYLELAFTAINESIEHSSKDAANYAADYAVNAINSRIGKHETGILSEVEKTIVKAKAKSASKKSSAKKSTKKTSKK